MPHDESHITALIRRLVLEWCAEHNETSERPVDLSAGEEAPLFGVERVLDSLALVGLLVAVEQGIDDALGVPLTLADEKAASQTRSPFRTIGSLVAYATLRTLEESRAGA
jgi:acyl carrier protein